MWSWRSEKHHIKPNPSLLYCNVLFSCIRHNVRHRHYDTLTTLNVDIIVSSQVILKDVDSLLYVDTDVLFLRPMDDIWSLLKSFNSSQLAAMAPEHEVPKIGWYSRFARHPFYGVTGVNSGVMLMNLTRIRSTMFKVRSKCQYFLALSSEGRWSELRFPFMHSQGLFWMCWSRRLSALSGMWLKPSDYHGNHTDFYPQNSI